MFSQYTLDVVSVVVVVTFNKEYFFTWLWQNRMKWNFQKNNMAQWWSTCENEEAEEKDRSSTPLQSTWGLNESTNTTQRHTHMRLVRKRWETTTTTHKRSSCKEDHHRTEQLKWSKLWSDISSEASSNLKRGRKWDTDRDDSKGSTQPLRLARGRTWKTFVSVENERAHKILKPLRPATIHR